MERCKGCRLVLPISGGERHAYLGGSAACWDLYAQVLAREYADRAYMAIHRLTVDAYAAQHPGTPEARTIQSINLHLVGLYLTLDRKLDPPFVRKVIGTLTHEGRRLRWLEPPTDLGALTVADVAPARTPDEHAEKVTAWGHGVWRAWGTHHAAIVALATSAINAMG